MSNHTINVRVKQKRDTDSNWQSKNPTPLNGEIILVDMSDGELRTKIGDGVSTYLQLPFIDEPLRNLIDDVDAKVDTVHGLVGDTPVSEQIAKSGSFLPAVTIDNNGQFLRVVDGAWAATSVSNAEEASF